MQNNFTKNLQKLGIPNDVPPEDRLLFYGLSIIVILTWWAELGISNVWFSLCSATALAFSLWQGFRVLLPTHNKINFVLAEKYTPTIIGFLWLILSLFIPYNADSTCIIVFIL